ncbi:MAG: serine/threonine protein kinase [Gemmatimonadetes bacterium]|nr:serine/threonine protein kinase [Gemmatimonadota bacterium]
MTTGEATCAACGAPLAAAQQFCARCGAAAGPVRRDPLRERLQELLGAELNVLDVVGRGGMAVVYAARDPLLERRVAVKAMLPEFAADAEMADRFLREARTAAQLQHPNIVSVFGARSRGDLLVMLMAFVEGRSLDAVLHEQGPLPLQVAGRLAADVASALQYAHEHQVIHRDVKPANVLLASNGGALVSDFGIARRQDVPGLTSEGMLLGSLSYMSPEQRTSEPLTGATDQYALGVSLFEMLTGRGPFVGSPIDVHVAHLNEPAPSVREFRPDVPEAVAQTIARMLRKTPAERYPDLREPKRVFDRLVTDARSASAVIAKLSGVLAAPTASRVISAVRKAPTVPIAAATAPPKARAGDAGAPTVAVAAPQAPAEPTVRAPAPGQSRGVLWAAIAVGVLIIGGAVVLKPRLAKAPPTAPPPVVAGPAPTQTVGAAQPAGDGAQSVATPVTGVPAERGERARSADQDATGPAGAPALTGVPLPTATVQQRPADPAPAPANPAATAPAAPPEAARAAPVEPAPALADARAAARALVTMMNQRRTRDLERLGDAGGGEAEARRTLERLVRDGDDFAAGFDRMASAPDAEGPAFVTEFVVEASWRSGGRDMAALYDVRLRLARQAGVWVPEGYSVRAR